MLSLIGTILKIALTVMFYAYVLIGLLIGWMSRPFGYLLHKLEQLFQKKLPISPLVNDRFSAFGGLMPFLLFVSAFVFLTVSVVINLNHPETGGDYFGNLIFSTTIGSVMGFISGGFDLKPATLVAIAFSGYLFSACMGTLEQFSKDEAGSVTRWRAKPYIRIPCFVVYFGTTASLAYMLTGVFGTIGDWGYHTIVTLYNQETASFFATAGKVIMLIPLGYVALVMFLITIKEYAESVAFGFVGFVLMLIGMLIVELATGAMENVTEQMTSNIQMVIFLASLVSMEAIRPTVLNKFENMIRETWEEAKAETQPPAAD